MAPMELDHNLFQRLADIQEITTVYKQALRPQGILV